MVSRHLSVISKVAMPESIRNKIPDRLCRLLPTRAVRRFTRHQDGAAAVEFALIAPIMITMYFGVTELSDGYTAKGKVTAFKINDFSVSPGVAEETSDTLVGAFRQKQQTIGLLGNNAAGLNVINERIHLSRPEP